MFVLEDHLTKLEGIIQVMLEEIEAGTLEDHVAEIEAVLMRKPPIVQ